jgi:hypothetical protein
MKSTFLYIMMVALLTACGHRASNTSSDNDSLAVDSMPIPDTPIELTLDTIQYEKEDSIASVKISIIWPKNGPKALVDSIRKFICEELSGEPVIGEDKPQVKLYEDGKAAVEACGVNSYKQLAKIWHESKEEGYAEGMTYGYFKGVYFQIETDKYVSYFSHTEGFTGGAHGYNMGYGMTFSKRNGQRIGYESEYDSKAEKFVIKNQTLFRITENPKLQAMLKEGVRSYFAEFSEDPLTEEELSEQLNGVDDINKIPLPQYAPYFSERGLEFIYQQYEIASYAVGMPSFCIPYDKVLPYLTKEAAELIK